MTDIEIPYEKDRHGWYRFFEILPGALSWFMLCLPFILALIDVRLAAVFVLIYLLINFMRGVAGAIRLVQGYRTMNYQKSLPWRAMFAELQAGLTKSKLPGHPVWHDEALRRVHASDRLIDPQSVMHAVIVATYKESREVLIPTIQSIIASNYDMKQVIFILAYEGRAGETTEKQAKDLVSEYGDVFYEALAIKHPQNIPGEIIGKGGNVTFAGRQLELYLRSHNIDPLRVLVTTLDADNRPHENYLPALSYVYSVCDDPVHTSFQPVSLYTNNIWDAPAPMRVLATGNSFFHLVTSLRQHALRNFSAHAQPMAALLLTDFWSVRTVVEDGHQFWRSYFRFDGKYRVLPLHVPIYQDAVLAETYRKTLKAQFLQLRRWTYGASDIAYFARLGFFEKNSIPRVDMVGKFWRLLEGHVTWAVGPILVLVGGFIPALFNPKSFAANELPIVVSRIQTIGLIVVIITLFMSLKTLPPKPARYKRHRTLWMILQWIYLPLTTLAFNSAAALYSQTRLMFGRYMSKFDVTEKAVVRDTPAGEKTSIQS